MGSRKEGRRDISRTVSEEAGALQPRNVRNKRCRVRARWNMIAAIRSEKSRLRMLSSVPFHSPFSRTPWTQPSTVVFSLSLSLFLFLFFTTFYPRRSSRSRSTHLLSPGWSSSALRSTGAAATYLFLPRRPNVDANFPRKFESWNSFFRICFWILREPATLSFAFALFLIQSFHKCELWHNLQKIKWSWTWKFLNQREILRWVTVQSRN